MKLFSVPISTALRRAKGFPRAYWGGSLAHAGVGIAILGMVGTSLWVTERQEVMFAGDSVEIAGLTVTLQDIDLRRVANYETEIARFSLSKDGRKVAILRPERRWYPIAQQQTVEAAITPRWSHDVYVAIGEPRGENGEGRLVRLYHHPLVLWLWSGALIMVAGGLLSLSDRRYRIGAPQKKVRPEPAPSTPAGVPAE